MPVTIKNISRTMQTYTLAHEKFRDSNGQHAYKKIHVTVVESDRRSGAMSSRKIAKHVPESIRFLAGEVRDGLDDEILNVEEIKCAVARSELRIVAQSPAGPVVSEKKAEGDKPAGDPTPTEGSVLPATLPDVSKASPKGK